MGADAELYIFDDERYREEVVPSLVRMLREGEPDGWLAELVAGLGGQEWLSLLLPHLRQRPTDLARHCTWLGPDLRLVGDEIGARGWGLEAWRPCRSVTCPERTGCPLHEDTGQALSEELNSLFEAAVATRCLGRSQFVGRSRHPLQYMHLLDAIGVAPGDELRDLLRALALRGGALGYMFEGSDGIHGWLTGEETQELAERLWALPLPAYEPTFEAMEGAHRSFPATAAVRHDWEALSLSFVRTVATIAAHEGKGALWGNDLLSWGNDVLSWER